MFLIAYGDSVDVCFPPEKKSHDLRGRVKLVLRDAVAFSKQRFSQFQYDLYKLFHVYGRNGHCLKIGCLAGVSNGIPNAAALSSQRRNGLLINLAGFDMEQALVDTVSLWHVYYAAILYQPVVELSNVLMP